MKNCPENSFYNWIGLALIALLPISCGTSLPTPEPITLSLAAATGIAPLAYDLAEAYQAAHPYITIHVEIAGNSLAAMEQVRLGRADLALITHPSPTIGADRALTAQIAWDVLALIVHPTNMMREISLAQARRIFAGRVQDWAQLGATPGLIQPVGREEGSGARAAFEGQVMDGQPVTPRVIIAPGSGDVVDLVASDPQSIGYVSVAQIDQRVIALTLAEIAPGAANGAARGYPLLVPVYLVAASDPPKAVLDLLDYGLSPAGQQVVTRRYGRVR